MQNKIKSEKRILYEELFPDRAANWSSKHYSRFTLPQLLNIKKRIQSYKKETK